MSRGKHLSLEEARKNGLLDQFAREHPNETDAERFERLLKAMANGISESKNGGKPEPAPVARSVSKQEKKKRDKPT